jgi:hypothetical protein
MARDMKINPKSAFVLLHKLREAMGAAAGTDELAGTVEYGAYFGKGPRQANRRIDRLDRRLLEVLRQVVVAASTPHVSRQSETTTCPTGWWGSAAACSDDAIASGSDSWYQAHNRGNATCCGAS